MRNSVLINSITPCLSSCWRIKLASRSKLSIAGQTANSHTSRRAHVYENERSWVPMPIAWGLNMWNFPCQDARLLLGLGVAPSDSLTDQVIRWSLTDFQLFTCLLSVYEFRFLFTHHSLSLSLTHNESRFYSLTHSLLSLSHTQTHTTTQKSKINVNPDPNRSIKDLIRLLSWT